MLQQVTQIVENALQNLGIEPKSAKVADGQYNITKDKKTEVLIDIWLQHDRVFFQALCSVNKINDITRSEVLKMLLEENHGLVQSCFAISGNDILIKETIEMTSFYKEEQILNIIHRVAYYCEAYREKWGVVLVQ